MRVTFDPAASDELDNIFAWIAKDMKGTHTGPLLGVPATNKPLASRAIDIWRVKDGKLVESWHAENLLNILFTIGALGGK